MGEQKWRQIDEDILIRGILRNIIQIVTGVEIIIESVLPEARKMFPRGREHCWPGDNEKSSQLFCLNDFCLIFGGF